MSFAALQRCFIHDISDIIYLIPKEFLRLSTQFRAKASLAEALAIVSRRREDALRKHNDLSRPPYFSSFLSLSLSDNHPTSRQLPEPIIRAASHHRSPRTSASDSITSQHHSEHPRIKIFVPFQLHILQPKFLFMLNQYHVSQCGPGTATITCVRCMLHDTSLRL